MTRPAREAALLLLAPFLTFASALAPAHIHEPAPGHDHDHHAVAHSHFAPHHVEEHDHLDPSGSVRLQPDVEIDHDDEVVVWVDNDILHQSVRHIDPIAAVGPLLHDTVEVPRHWSVTPFDDAAPVHGPPRPATPYRGPPPSAV